MKNIKLYFTKSSNGVIGRENESIWYLHKEIFDFKDRTKNQIILMGNRAWEVIPTSLKPSNNCFTIIASKDKTFTYYSDNVNVIYDLDWYIQEYCNDQSESRELWIVGGSSILNQTIKYADEIEVIEVMKEIKGDILAPKIDGRSFKMVNSTSAETDNFSNLSYYRTIYKRISKSCVQRGINQME